MSDDLSRLQKAYPDHIQFISEQVVIWKDGTKMQVQDAYPSKTLQEKLDHPSLYDQVAGIHYLPGLPISHPITDPGRIRYEPFFRKMYGNSQTEVEANLAVIYWMPKYFDIKYPLLVTTINNVDKKLQQISTELEDLVAHYPDYLAFLDNPGGTYDWRLIANTNRLSMHSFGMTIDINSHLSNYWQWDLEKNGLIVTEDTRLSYRNDIPWAIVLIFENYGFIWGGKWKHYDSMHFEYRPELF